MTCIQNIQPTKKESHWFHHEAHNVQHSNTKKESPWSHQETHNVNITNQERKPLISSWDTQHSTFNKQTIKTSHLSSSNYDCTQYVLEWGKIRLKHTLDKIGENLPILEKLIEDCSRTNPNPTTNSAKHCKDPHLKNISISWSSRKLLSWKTRLRDFKGDNKHHFKFSTRFSLSTLRIKLRKP